MADEREQLLSVLDDFNTAILATHSRDQGIHGRPMSIAQRHETQLWFVTARGTEKVEEIQQDEHAMVALQESGRFACLSGTISTVVDPDLLKRVWKDSWRPWFKGADDPSLVLLRFDLQRGEYWDMRGIKAIRLAWDAARAMAKGESLSGGEPWRHGVVQP